MRFLTLSAALLASLCSGCFRHATIPWTSSYGSCVDCEGAVAPAPVSSMDRKQARELRRWYREMNRQQGRGGMPGGAYGGYDPCVCGSEMCCDDGFNAYGADPYQFDGGMAYNGMPAQSWGSSGGGGGFCPHCQQQSMMGMSGPPMDPGMVSSPAMTPPAPQAMPQPNTLAPADVYNPETTPMPTPAPSSGDPVQQMLFLPPQQLPSAQYHY